MSFQGKAPNTKITKNNNKTYMYTVIVSMVKAADQSNSFTNLGYMYTHRDNKSNFNYQ